MKQSASVQIIVIMLVALTTIAAAAWVAWQLIDGNRSTATATQPMAVQSPVSIGGPFTLTNHKGETVTDASFRGRYMLVFFGYGYCPDICPTELANMAAAMDYLGPAADTVQPVFISVDPARDTPEYLAQYVAHFHPKLVGLTGTASEIQKIAKAYRVFYAKMPSEDPDGYLINHSSFVYLMDPDGTHLALFRHQTDPKEMADAIAELVAGRRKVSLKPR